MAKQIINVGTAANSKNGDSLRSAFQKVNANFTELYTQLGLINDPTLNLGAFEFTGSVMTTNDSSNMTIGESGTVINIAGDLVPSVANGGDLGSPSKPWNSLYVSTSTIYFGGVPLSLDADNNLLINNSPISSEIEYASIPNAPTDISDLTDTGGLLGGAAGPTQPYLELTDTPFITQPVTLGTPVTVSTPGDGSGAQVEVVIGAGPVITSVTVTTPGSNYIVGQRYKVWYYQIGGSTDISSIEFNVATVSSGGLLTVTNAAFVGAATNTPGTYSGLDIQYRASPGDAIDNGVTLVRSSQGALFNIEEEAEYDDTNYISPIGTEWNNDGWGNLVGLATRSYTTFRSALNGAVGENIIGAELVMHDTINDKYYKFSFTNWGGNNGGSYAYTRTLITDPNYFKKANYATANDVDVIEDDSTLQIGITRDNNNGIYNPFTEEDWNSNVSPDGTLWNIDGWNDLTDVETRTYDNFNDAYNGNLGNNVPGSQAVMYVPSIDKYYAVEWLGWTQNNQGGGFSYTRREIDLTKLDQGVRFADGTVQTTAYTATNVLSTAPNDRRIETASGYKEVAVTQRTTGAAVTSTAAQGNELALGFVNVVVSSPQQTALNAIVNSGAFYDFEVSLNQTNWFSANYGGSGFSGGNLYFQLNLRNGVTLPVAQGDTVYYRITTGGDSVVWWNKAELPGGAGNFRGAVIDYHAYTGEGTIIGTIHIVDDDGEEYITHTEVSSGGDDSMNDNLWIVTSEGQIRYARFDLEAKTLKIHWTAKVFYGSELYD